MPVLESLGDHVPPGCFSVHSSFEHCLNFACGPHLVALVDDTVGGGPCNIVARAGTFAGATSLRVTEQAITIDGREFATAALPRYSSTLTLAPPPSWNTLQQGLDLLERVIRDEAAEHSLAFLLGGPAPASSAFERAFHERCRRGARLLAGGDPVAAAEILRGTGYGLTPSGDDFLCGLLVASHLAQAADGRRRDEERALIHAAAQGDNLLSNSFLHAACQGWLHEPVKQLVLALADADPASLLRAARRALARGETSGADTAVGLVMGLRLQAPVATEQSLTIG